MELNLFQTVWQSQFQALIPGWSLVVAKLEGGMLGTCCRGSKTIEISEDVWDSTRKVDVVRILAHEVAHALAKDNACDHHSPDWKARCIELGGSGRVLEHIARRNHNPYVKRCCELYQDTLPLDLEITRDVEFQIQKRAMEELLAKGADPTVLLQMYMDSRDSWASS